MKTLDINKQNQRRKTTTWALGALTNELSGLMTWTSVIMENQDCSQECKPLVPCHPVLSADLEYDCWGPRVSSVS